MGSGTWSSATYSAVSGAKIRAGATFDYSARATGVHEKLDPKRLNAAGQNIRESRDSDEHPASTPIIVGFDETGSMGSIPRLVLTKLKTLFSLLVDKGYATDPQIAVAAYGDAANGERAPLQISQFESDNRIDDNLDLIFLEGLGGGNNGETSNLLLYYAAAHVSTDAFDRRGRKGHLIIIGDERQVPLTPEMIRTYVGDEQPLLEDISFEGIARAVTEKWDVWILLIDNAAARMQHSEAFYTDLFGPDHVLVVEDPDTIAETIAALIGYAEGRDADAIADACAELTRAGVPLGGIRLVLVTHSIPVGMERGSAPHAGDDAGAKADDPAKAARPDGAPSDVGGRILLGCLDAVTLARISLTGRAVERVGELPLSEHHILASDGATGVLGALVRDGFSALPVVEARPRGGFALVGWVTREQMVERVYRQQRRAFEEAQVRTSLGARVQQRWRGRSARG